MSLLQLQHKCNASLSCAYQISVISLPGASDKSPGIFPHKEHCYMQNTKDSSSRNEISEIAAYTIAVASIAALLIIRGALFYHESWDYINFLSEWVGKYRNMTFFEALGTNVGNYNPPYMYFLNIISRINAPDLYLIKSVSIIFDALLAYFVMKIVSLRTDSLNIRILAFVLAFAIPTVVLNSSMWAQCDSIYTAFAIGSVYFALQNRSKMAYAFIAIALSFKLQAAFIFPVFIVFLLTKKIRFRDCYVFFLVYFTMLLPAIISGMPVSNLLSVYFNQTVTYEHLKLNAINMWQFVDGVEFIYFKIAGLFTCSLIVLGILYFVFVNKERLVNDVDYVRLVFLFAVILPYVLPQMHDRFFYMADVLSLTVFLYDKRRWYVPVVTVFCSFTAYAWYLMNWIVIIDYRYAAIALMIVIFIVLRDLVISLTPVKLIDS